MGLLFLSQLLSILWTSFGGSGEGDSSAGPPFGLLELLAGVQEEPCGPVQEASGAASSGGSRLYPPCFLLSLLKMESMLSTSRRGRHLPEAAPPEQQEVDLSRVLVEELETAGRTAAGGEEEEEEEEEEERARLWMMLLMVSFRSRRKEEEGLWGWRGTCCSFNVSPGGATKHEAEL